MQAKPKLGTAIVTGATDGIGFAIAEGLVNRGFGVVITGRNEPLFKLPEHMRFVRVDHADPAGPKELVSQLDDRFGPLTALINNVGRRHGYAVTELEHESLAQTMMLNAIGPMLLTKELVPHFSAAGGAIVNISSRLAVVGMDGVSGYSASKGAINSFTVAAAVELAPKNIRVNAVAPGMTKTAMIESWLSEQPDPEAAEKGVAARIPLGRLATVSDIVGPVVFLASPESGYMTGAILPADGGYTVG